MTTTILITAGEASGDRLGGALMAALKRKRKDLRFIGVGGPAMEAEGLSPLFPMSDLSVMGLLEVIPAIPRILSRVSQLARLAETELPALVITIDSQDFSARVAKAMHQLRIPHVQYSAPKIWAWRQHRVHKLKNLYTHLLTILPFEAQFFSSAGIPTTYVGHPAITALAPYKTDNQTFALALLPGSRKSELKRHWPTMLATYRRLRQLHPQLSAVLALPNESAVHTLREIAPWHMSENIQLVFGEGRFLALAQCRAALAKSGTVNLELALLGVPAVVLYKMNPITHFIAQYLIKLPAISLPNLILGKTVYPEFIQSAATPENLARALHPLLSDPKSHQRQSILLTQLAAAMRTPLPPAELAANTILPLLPR